MECKHVQSGAPKSFLYCFYGQASGCVVANALGNVLKNAWFKFGQNAVMVLRVVGNARCLTVLPPNWFAPYAMLQIDRITQGVGGLGLKSVYYLVYVCGGREIQYLREA